MKVNKFLMLGIAGLAFAACSNEEIFTDNNQLPEGVAGAVSIKLVNPTMTRAIHDATTGNDPVTVVPADGTTVDITLTAATGGTTISLSKEEWEAGKVVTFWNVTSPSKVEVSMNNGVASYDAVNITGGTPELQVIPANIPVYGFVDQKDIHLTSNEDTPTSTTDDHETGATADDVNNHTTFQMYEATVQLKIPVARLEVSGIKHGTGNMFKTLTFAGVYMDNYKVNNAATTPRGNYRYSGDTNGFDTDGILFTPNIEETNFLSSTPDIEWPNADGKVYAFNFYGPTAEEIAAAKTSEAMQALNPKFKLYFSLAESADDATNIDSPRYAMITKYTSDGTNDIVLQNGHIYRITDVTLNDDNIIPNEDGKEVYGVTVTVKEATWTIVDIEADWAN